jgi:hypothetical protein
MQGGCTIGACCVVLFAAHQKEQGTWAASVLAQPVACPVGTVRRWMFGSGLSIEDLAEQMIASPSLKNRPLDSLERRLSLPSNVRTRRYGDQLCFAPEGRDKWLILSCEDSLEHPKILQERIIAWIANEKRA